MTPPETPEQEPKSPLGEMIETFLDGVNPLHDPLHDPAANDAVEGGPETNPDDAAPAPMTEAVQGAFAPQRPIIRCSFCMKAEHEVAVILRSNRTPAYICNECIAGCVTLISQQLHARMDAMPS